MSQKKSKPSQKKSMVVSKGEQHGSHGQARLYFSPHSQLLLRASGVNIDNRPTNDRSVVSFGIFRETRMDFFNFAVICG